MGRIKILPKEVISRIAAGEVIERPASVVKELLENSIDADAKRISLEIERSGTRLIKVIDDGAGMTKEDLSLCIKRYATSKISSLEDLSHIRTLGFRGEALTSIAAVSKLSITSKPHNQLIGHKIIAEAGKEISLKVIGAPSGTIVEVRDLFFNIPARRKFLRASKTETSKIMDTFIRISLSHLHIHFSFKNNERLILNLPPTDDPLSRFSLIFGEEMIEHMKKRRERHDRIDVAVCISDSEMKRSRPDRLFFYVNGRNIKDKLLMKAVIEGYGERLMRREYPQGMVFIEIDPELVDVNVHPTKREVRFHDEEYVYEAVSRCVRNAFLFSDRPSFYFVEIKEGLIKEEEQKYIPACEIPRIIGQIKDTYILCEDKEGIILIDQHAAHERIIYEKLKRDLKDRNIKSQRVAEPYRVELNPIDSEILFEKIDSLLEIGIDITPFGGNTFLISSFPLILKDLNWKSFLDEIIKEGKSISLDNILKAMACHTAIKAGESLNLDEMKNLVKELYKTSLPSHCPHGRPTIKKITYSELEKMFKRGS